MNRYSSLPENEKLAFARLAESEEIKQAFNKRFPGYNLSMFYLSSSPFLFIHIQYVTRTLTHRKKKKYVGRVNGMDEVYATGPPVKGTSDEVFYTKHIDGPFEFYRFASVYRCLIALDDNTTTVTKLPMIPDQITATTGDVFGFDFNNEIHYIEKDPSRREDKDQRIVLKCHYVVSPPLLGFWGSLLGKLNVLYNMCFRALFLKTIRPSTWFEDVLARFGVVGVTKLVYQIEQYLGYNNIMYIALVLVNALSLNSFELWLVCTSFVHYLRYITTYYNRDNIAYEDFKRDVLLFKSIALMNLAYVYLSPFDFEISRVLNEVNPRCLVMIVVGYGLSMKATKALGLDRTYFGVELGFLKPKWIHEFPYVSSVFVCACFPYHAYNEF